MTSDSPIDAVESPEMSSEHTDGIARSAGIIAAGNISSRVLGMGRMTLIAGIFGATGLVSAYQVAATVPIMTYELLVGGVLSSALVPIFSEYAASRHRKDLSRLVSTVLGITLLVLIGVVLLIEIFAPQIARALGGGFPPELQAISANLIRVSGIALLFLGLSGVITAILYTLKRFALPSFGAAAFNVGIIICAVFLSGRLGIYSLAIGIVVGSLIQLLIQVPALRGVTLGISFDLSHPGLRRIARLYLPVLAGLVITQIQIAVDRNLASHTGEQSIAWMMNATTLIQFPHGLIAVAISLAVLPALSRLFAIKDMAGYSRALSLGLRLVIVLIVPAVVGAVHSGKARRRDDFRAWPVHCYRHGLDYVRSSVLPLGACIRRHRLAAQLCLVCTPGHADTSAGGGVQYCHLSVRGLFTPPSLRDDRACPRRFLQATRACSDHADTDSWATGRCGRQTCARDAAKDNPSVVAHGSSYPHSHEMVTPLRYSQWLHEQSDRIGCRGHFRIVHLSAAECVVGTARNHHPLEHCLQEAPSPLRGAFSLNPRSVQKQKSEENKLSSDLLEGYSIRRRLVRQRKPPRYRAAYISAVLCRNAGIHGAYFCAARAVGAQFRVDDVGVFTFADRILRAFRFTRTAHDAVVSNLVSHLELPSIRSVVE